MCKLNSREIMYIKTCLKLFIDDVDSDMMYVYKELYKRIDNLKTCSLDYLTHSELEFKCLLNAVEYITNYYINEKQLGLKHKMYMLYMRLYQYGKDKRYIKMESLK